MPKHTFKEYGAGYWTRTHDPLLTGQPLLPTELIRHEFGGAGRIRTLAGYHYPLSVFKTDPLSHLGTAPLSNLFYNATVKM